MIQAGWVGTRDVRPSDGVNLNAAPPNGGKAGQPFYELYGNADSIQDMYPIDASKYEALQAKLNHRVGDANFGFAYTFSKSMDAADNEEGSSITWEWAPIMYRNYALSGYDRTHNFQAFGNYALPFGRGKNMLNHGVGAALAGGWQTNWILSRYSGTPFSDQLFGDVLEFAWQFADRQSGASHRRRSSAAMGPEIHISIPPPLPPSPHRHSAIAAAILSAVPASST